MEPHKSLRLLRSCVLITLLLDLWDVASGEAVGTLSGHSDIVWDVALSPDGSVYARSNYELWFEADSPGGIGALTFSPDGRLLASGGANGEVQLESYVSALI